MNKYILKFEVAYNEMVSTNEAYFHRPKKSKYGNRMTTYTTKTDKLKKYQTYFDEVFEHLIPEDYIRIVSNLIDSKLYGLRIVTIYSMPYENYRDSDTTNYIKNYEDCIATRLRKLNKNLDDKNNLEYRAIKRYYNADSDMWKMITLIMPIERDAIYRSEILQLYCKTCDKQCHCDLDTETKQIICRNCGNEIGLYLNPEKILYGMTLADEENQCDVCGMIMKSKGACPCCGVVKSEYRDLIDNFNEEELIYEE